MLQFITLAAIITVCHYHWILFCPNLLKTNTQTKKKQAASSLELMKHRASTDKTGKLKANFSRKSLTATESPCVFMGIITNIIGDGK